MSNKKPVANKQHLDWEYIVLMFQWVALLFQTHALL